MTAIVDSSVIIDALRGREDALTALERARREEGRLQASEMTRFEVLAGRRPGEAGNIHKFFAAFTWHPIDTAITERAAEFARAYRASHSGIDAGDYLIAATADVIGARLMTRNVKHFPMFTGLTAPY